MSDPRIIAALGEPILQAARAAAAKAAAATKASAEAVAKRAAANGLIRDPVTGKWMRAADLPHPGEGADLGGKFSPSGFDRDPATGRIMPRVPVDQSVTLPPARPGSALVPVGQPSADVAQFLDKANAAAANSGADASRWGEDALWGLKRAIGITAPVAAVMLANGRGPPVGPAASEPVPSGGPHQMLSAADAYRLGMASPPFAGWVSPENRPEPQGWHEPAAHPAVQAAVRQVPTPPPRPAELQPGLMDRIFNGGNYQSNGRLVSTPTDGAPINWGDNDRASDFVRADKQAQLEGGYARGGMPTAHEQALHKAMHIIHHLITRR